MRKRSNSHRYKVLAVFAAGAMVTTGWLATHHHPKHQPSQLATQPVHPDYSRPKKIIPACETEVCQTTAIKVKRAVRLWRQKARELGWDVPSFMDENAELRYVGLESVMGAATHRPGSQYSGILQFSETDPNGIYLTNIQNFLPILNAAQKDIPALRQEEIAEKVRIIAAAKAELAIDIKHAATLRKALAHASHADHASTGHSQPHARSAAKPATAKSATRTGKTHLRHPPAANHRDAKAPSRAIATKERHPQTSHKITASSQINLETLRAQLATVEHQIADDRERLSEAEARTRFPVTRQTLDRVFNDPTVQIFMDLTARRLSDQRLSEAHPNYRALSDHDKVAIHYFMHNAPALGIVIANNLAPPPPPPVLTPPESTMHRLFRKLGESIGLLSPQQQHKRVIPEDTKRSIDDLSRERKPTGYGYIFKANSGLYEGEGRAYPREAVSRFYAITDQYVRLYSGDDQPRLTSAPKPTQPAQVKVATRQNTPNSARPL